MSDGYIIGNRHILRMDKKRISSFLFAALLSIGVHHICFSQNRLDDALIRKIDKEVIHLMQKGNIPGASLVLTDGARQVIRTYGYADLAAGIPVTSQTLFQLGSLSKAFTALAVMKLARDGKIALQKPVSYYIPWFNATYRDSSVNIMVLELLHHTSGIPWQSIASIPERNDSNALEQTVRKVAGLRLRSMPGKRYEYATVNYDILAFIVQQVSGMPFEDFVQQHVIEPLQLSNTTVGIAKDSTLLATGYKTGFFSARPYKAPVYKGNNAAGYIISNAADMQKWLRFQMGLQERNELFDLALLTRQRDETVPLHGMYSYAMGWEVSLSGNTELNHGGVNPNYTAYIAFRSKSKIGMVLLTNSGSSMTPDIGNAVMKLLAGEKIRKNSGLEAGNGRVYATISIILAVYILIVLAVLGNIVVGIIKRSRIYKITFPATWRSMLFSLAMVMPFAYAIYIYPAALGGFTWHTLFVWSPFSLETAVWLAIGAGGVSFITYFISLFFPEENKYKRVAPRLLLMSILSGLANMFLIILITSALDSDIRLRYQVFYYSIILLLYLFGRRFVQINLIRLSRQLIYELKIKLTDKIFSTSYQKFEKIDRGQVYTVLNDDVEAIGGTAGQFIMLVTNAFTILGAFIYLASIAFWSTLVTILLITVMSSVYYFVSRNTNHYFEKARDSRNIFIRLVNGMIEGYKEISLRRNKKLLYRNDIMDVAKEYRDRLSLANIRFVNAFLIGESLLTLLLGIVVFGIPRAFPGISNTTIMSFVIVVLYLIGPINAILGAIPAIMQLRVAWKRITGFINDIPANLSIEKATEISTNRIKSIKAEGLVYQYKNKDGLEAFRVGPIDLEVKTGEILFVIGGNGSGKTTLAKLLTGLYDPDEGRILIDGQVMESSRISEYFSAVFNPAYLFEKLYNIDTLQKKEEIEKYLRVLHLHEKVKITDNRYNTIDLSGGQKKRLALLQCYLEDSPVYLFDEWAADQDPEYRNFFYRTLLPLMRHSGKIVIAITHDDHYFDVADRVVKMNQGKLETYTGDYILTPIDPSEMSL
jgi:putative ATP-binding cassette transporter